jgi:DNA polymerase-3 subunit alpha
VRLVNKKCIESLVYAGALDSLHGTRAQLFAAIDLALDYGSGFQKDRLSGQVNLFDDLFGADAGAPSGGRAAAEPPLPGCEPWPYNQLLQYEKEVLNFYVSGHPLDRYQDEIRGFSTISLAGEALAEVKDGAQVTVGGMITKFRPHTQHNGKPMAFLEIEEFSGSIELIVFGEAFEKFRHLLAPDAMVLVHGTIGKRDNEEKAKLKVDNCIALADARAALTRSVHIRLHSPGLEPEFLHDIKQLASAKQGECRLILHLVTGERNEYRIRARGCSVSPDPEVIKTLRAKIGKENVWLAKNAA